MESTTSLNVEEADELFSTASNGIYSVTGNKVGSYTICVASFTFE